MNNNIIWLSKNDTLNKANNLYKSDVFCYYFLFIPVHLKNIGKCVS